MFSVARRLMATSVVTVSLLLLAQSGADALPHSVLPTALDPFAGNMPPTTLATMREQEKLQPAVAILQKAIDLPIATGFAGIAFEASGIALYWKGDLPSAVESAVADAQRLGAVVVRSANFSKVELEKAAESIADIAERGSDMQSIEVLYDGSGLEIERMDHKGRMRAATRSAGLLRNIDDIVKDLEVDVPVTFRTAPSISFQSCPASGCNRLDDEAPWNSGGFAGSPTNGWICTTGFAVYKPVPYGQAQQRILTAAHCGSSGDYFTDSTGETIGYIGLDDWDRDVATIQAEGWYWMWDGGSSSSFHKTVNDYGYRIVGELLCQSGRHGVKCDLETQSGLYAVWCEGDSDGDSFYMHNISKAIRTTGATAALAGDSGGPVFSLSGNGVRAKGLASARGGPNNSHLYYSGMDNIVSRNGYYPRRG